MSRFLLILAILLPAWISAAAEYSFNAGAQLNLGVGSNEFAPFYLHANRHGKITQSKNAQLDVWAIDSLDLDKRFDFSWGVEALGGYASKADYRRWNPETKEFYQNPQGPAAIWLQQLFAEVKWRCLFLSVGLKDRDSWFVDQELSSGDLLWSGNSRGIPEVRIGFVDFQNIPFTKKWLQFDVCLSYGKFMDSSWNNNHFDYYTGKRNTGEWWTYKRLALRTNPTKPFVFQIGIQMSGIFGGWKYQYWYGDMTQATDNYSGFKDFIQILLPFWSSEKEGYRVGDSKGTWDIAASYRFKSGEYIRAYTQWPWEDSSGIARKNGFDGLWGLEFKLDHRWWITGAAMEYIDMTHMSGPLLFDGNYHNPAKPFPYKADGADLYYNNYYYRSYVNYGLNMGTPMVAGTLFITGDDPNNINNGDINYFRVRGFHIAVEGAIGDDIDYVVKYNHRKAWGSANTAALIHPVEADSFMAGATWRIPQISGLSLGAAIGIDHGKIPSNAAGGIVTLTYERPILFYK